MWARYLTWQFFVTRITLSHRGKRTVALPICPNMLFVVAAKRHPPNLFLCLLSRELQYKTWVQSILSALIFFVFQAKQCFLCVFINFRSPKPTSKNRADSALTDLLMRHLLGLLAVKNFGWSRNISLACFPKCYGHTCVQTKHQLRSARVFRFASLGIKLGPPFFFHLNVIKIVFTGASFLL